MNNNVDSCRVYFLVKETAMLTFVCQFWSQSKTSKYPVEKQNKNFVKELQDLMKISVENVWKIYLKAKMLINSQLNKIKISETDELLKIAFKFCLKSHNYVRITWGER